MSGSFTETVWPLTINNITCTGSEENLLQCDFSTHLNPVCHHTQDASIVCQCKKHTHIQIHTCNHEWSMNAVTTRILRWTHACMYSYIIHSHNNAQLIVVSELMLFCKIKLSFSRIQLAQNSLLIIRRSWTMVGKTHLETWMVHARARLLHMYSLAYIETTSYTMASIIFLWKK